MKRPQVVRWSPDLAQGFDRRSQIFWWAGGAWGRTGGRGQWLGRETGHNSQEIGLNSDAGLLVVRYHDVSNSEVSDGEV